MLFSNCFFPKHTPVYTAVNGYLTLFRVKKVELRGRETVRHLYLSGSLPYDHNHGILTLGVGLAYTWKQWLSTWQVPGSSPGRAMWFFLSVPNSPNFNLKFKWAPSPLFGWGKKVSKGEEISTALNMLSLGRRWGIKHLVLTPYHQRVMGDHCLYLTDISRKMVYTDLYELG